MKLLLTGLLLVIPCATIQGATSQLTSVSQKTNDSLEKILKCQSGTIFTEKSITFLFQAAGLKKTTDGIFVPVTQSPPVSIFSDDVVAALFSNGDGEIKTSVYLKNQNAKKLAKKLGANNIDEYANTDEPSYFRQTSKKTTLLVGSADSLTVGNDSVHYNSMISCQIIK